VDYVRRHDPQRPSFLTVDLTYKPANYYIYGPIADVINPDCYPQVTGQPATQVREVVETCRYGAGPRPVTFTFSSTLEGDRDPEKFEKMRFPRAYFPLEERVMLYYAIGAGARGLYNYIHCTENSERRWSRGSTDWPELWNAIGRVYRELDQVAPLLSLAHPTKLATSDQEKLWLRTLLCGEDAALIVWVNDNYEQNRLGVRYQPLEGVRVRVPELPWLEGWKAYGVGQGTFTALEAVGGEITLPRADVAGMILLTAKDGLVDRLATRYEENEKAIGRLLLREWRWGQNRRARELELTRLITGELSAFAVEGTAQGAYGMSLDSFWNPKGEQHNVLEFGANEATDQQVRGAQYGVTIPAEQAGKPYLVYAQGGGWGRPCKLTVTGPGDQSLLDQETEAGFSGELMVFTFTPQQAGEHVVKYAQGGPGARGGRITRTIYVLPASEAFEPLPRG